MSLGRIPAFPHTRPQTTARSVLHRLAREHFDLDTGHHAMLQNQLAKRDAPIQRRPYGTRCMLLQQYTFTYRIALLWGLSIRAANRPLSYTAGPVHAALAVAGWNTYRRPPNGHVISSTASECAAHGRRPVDNITTYRVPENKHPGPCV